jgi:hypothetical protein
MVCLFSARTRVIQARRLGPRTREMLSGCCSQIVRGRSQRLQRARLPRRAWVPIIILLSDSIGAESEKRRKYSGARELVICHQQTGPQMQGTTEAAARAITQINHHARSSLCFFALSPPLSLCSAPCIFKLALIAPCAIF